MAKTNAKRLGFTLIGAALVLLPPASLSRGRTTNKPTPARQRYRWRVRRDPEAAPDTTA